MHDSDWLLVSVEDKSKANRDLSSPLPAKKKAKGERGSIKAFFKGKTTSDQNNEQKENQPSSVPDTGRTTRSTRRSKPKYDEPVLMAAENNFISSVHVEKTSLILFDEVSD